jgi:hypothetical protein
MNIDGAPALVVGKKELLFSGSGRLYNDRRKENQQRDKRRGKLSYHHLPPVFHVFKNVCAQTGAMLPVNNLPHFEIIYNCSFSPKNK